MKLREEILREHSKAQALKIATWIGVDKKRFDQLMKMLLEDEYRVVQRAAWVLSIVGQNRPKLLNSYFSDLVKKIKEPNLPTAVRRNVLKILQDVAIPKKLHGSLMNTCFQLLADPKETIAVRCWAMSVLGNLSNNYPTIKKELQTVVEEALKQNPSAGFKARARKVLNIHKSS